MTWSANPMIRQCPRCGGFCSGPCEREPISADHIALAVTKIRFAVDHVRRSGDTVSLALLEQALEALR